MSISIGANHISKALRMKFSINLCIDIKELAYKSKSWSAMFKYASLLRDNLSQW